MKTIIFLIALALVSPGLYDIGKAVQARRNADAQAAYDAERIKLADSRKQATEQAAKVAAAEKLERYRKAPSPATTWTYDQGTQRWVEHQRGVSVRQSRGGF
jgi:hypothetical protein